jgi:hypothetical protein
MTAIHIHLYDSTGAGMAPELAPSELHLTAKYLHEARAKRYGETSEAGAAHKTAAVLHTQAAAAHKAASAPEAKHNSSLKAKAKQATERAQKYSVGVKTQFDKDIDAQHADREKRRKKVNNVFMRQRMAKLKVTK